jgi:glycosyltransferase involved in cell wall biosynthesis
MASAKKTILLYSDCPFFAGCENLISVITRSASITSKYDLSFSYARSTEYEKGMRQALDLNRLKTIPISVFTGDYSLFHLKNWQKRSPLHRILGQIIQVAIIIPRRLGITLPIHFFQFVLLLKRENPDLIHINNGGYPGALSARILVLTAKWLGFRNLAMTINNQAGPTDNLIEVCIDRKIILALKKVITASKNAAMSLEKNRGVSSDQIESIPNTIHTPVPTQTRERLLSLHQIPLDRFIVSEIALLTDRKGQKHLLEALALIKEQNQTLSQKVALIFVGDGEDEFSLKELASRLGVQDQVYFVGSRNNYSDYIEASDVIVQPSTRNEDMPLVVLSAMELKRAIIGTDVGGMKEQIESEKEGLILPPGDSNALAQALIRLLLDQNLRSTFAQAAHERFRQSFSSASIEKRYLALYDQVLGSPT